MRTSVQLLLISAAFIVLVQDFCIGRISAESYSTRTITFLVTSVSHVSFTGTITFHSVSAVVNSSVTWYSFTAGSLSTVVSYTSVIYTSVLTQEITAAAESHLQEYANVAEIIGVLITISALAYGGYRKYLKGPNLAQFPQLLHELQVMHENLNNNNPEQALRRFEYIQGQGLETTLRRKSARLVALLNDLSERIDSLGSGWTEDDARRVLGEVGYRAANEYGPLDEDMRSALTARDGQVHELCNAIMREISRILAE